MILKYAILGLLHYRNMHGYRIKNHIESNFGYMWSVNYGQIYPILKKMQQEGLVSMVEVLQDNAPSKKLYSITPKGREEFARWLASEPEKLMILRDPFLLRFTFFGFGDADRALDLLDKRIELVDQELARRKENLPRWRNENIYVRLLSELGVSLNITMLEWMRHAREEIASEGAPTRRKKITAVRRGRH